MCYIDTGLTTTRHNHLQEQLQQKAEDNIKQQLMFELAFITLPILHIFLLGILLLLSYPITQSLDHVRNSLFKDIIQFLNY